MFFNLRTVIVTAAVHRGFSRQLFPKNNQLLSPSGTGQASAPIYRITTLRRPVFLINSCVGLVTATLFLCKAPLLPKLRGQFAEFLRESSLAPLSILYLPTCVGFRYRDFLCFISKRGVRAFLGSMTSLASSFRRKKTGSRLNSRVVFIRPINVLNASTTIHK